jgi:hypothetical protein
MEMSFLIVNMQAQVLYEILVTFMIYLHTELHTINSNGSFRH